MKNNKYSVLVFDLGNVMIPFDYDLVTSKLDEYKKGLGDKFKKMYYDNYHIHRSYETSKITTEEFLEINLGWLDNEVTAEQFISAYCNVFTENKKLTGMLSSLKEKYTIVALSNTNYLHQKYAWEKYDFIKYFDKMILSHEVGAYKPEPEIYKAVEDFTGESPEKHFFTDDVLEYVEGAKSRGWGGAQYSNHDAYIAFLKSIQII